MKDHKKYNEVIEGLIEDWAFENIKDGKFRCPSCNEWKDLEDSEKSSTNSLFSLLICKNCHNPKVQIS